MQHFVVRTHRHRELLDVTRQAQEAVAASGVAEGFCLVYSPHTTAGVTINENADPDVLDDLLRAWTEMLGNESRFRHAEGNAGGHALTSLVGASALVPVSERRLRLGTWQAVYLCEFDGPRERTLLVQVLRDGGPLRP